MEASVILSKCSIHNRTFGIRIEKRNNDWGRTWAFKIDEEKAKREGFDQTKITGSLDASPDYPGCPYCGERYGFVLCNCGKMSCWTPGKEAGTCHWCGVYLNNLVSAESFDVSSGGL